MNRLTSAGCRARICPSGAGADPGPTTWLDQKHVHRRDYYPFAVEGTGSYGAVLADVLAEVDYRVVETPTPRRERGRSKTDTLDAVLAARSTTGVPLALLPDRRAGEVQTALQVLTSARDQLNADRLRCINALTALVRGHDLGLDSRRALTTGQIQVIAGWRRRRVPLGIQTAPTPPPRQAGPRPAAPCPA